MRISDWSSDGCSSDLGAVTGIFYFTAGPIGTALALWAQRKFAEKHIDGSMRVLILGLLIGVPASALYPVMPTSGFAVALMFVAFIGKSVATRSEEHTSELQSLMRISYAVFCLKKKN